MSGSTHYDDDILLWSEQQAAAIRKLGTMRRDLPNELAYEGAQQQLVTGFPLQCAFKLEDLIAEQIDSLALLQRLQG